MPPTFGCGRNPKRPNPLRGRGRPPGARFMSPQEFKVRNTQYPAFSRANRRSCARPVRASRQRFSRTGYWVLGTGYWVLGTGYWVLGTVRRATPRRISGSPKANKRQRPACKPPDPRMACFPRKTVPPTEHKKHYRTLEGGLNCRPSPFYERDRTDPIGLSRWSATDRAS